jgi:hypothetical protein
MKKSATTAILIFYYLLTNAQAPTTGLVGYWKLDGIFNSEVATSQNGTNFNATSTANNSGSLGAAMQFNNPTSTVAQYATHPINAALNFSSTSSFSLSFFINVNNPFPSHAIGVYDNNLNYGGYGVWLWNSNGFPQLQFNVKNGSIGTTNGAITLGNWMHITVVKNANTLNIYVNGVLNASGAAGSTSPTYSYAARIGSMFYNDIAPPQYNGFVGKIDELRIYNRALSLAEIAQIQILLPIKLNSFTATLQNNKTILNWQTAQEQNSKQFIVERSIDGQNFEAIQTIVAAGNSAVDKSYNYIDNLSSVLLQNKVLYYRIKMEDLDGSYTLSKVLPILVKQNKLIINVSPNPVVDILNVKTNAIGLGITSFRIIDLQGKVLQQQNVKITQPIQTTNIDIKRLMPGTYFLKVNNNNSVTTQKFIKQL